eukprot:5254847-Amphidinium_carterae.1
MSIANKSTKNVRMVHNLRLGCSCLALGFSRIQSRTQMERHVPKRQELHLYRKMTTPTNLDMFTATESADLQWCSPELSIVYFQSLLLDMHIDIPL